MQKKLILSLCCALAFIQFSCISVLFVEATKPAEVAIANEQWKVAVINRYNPQLLDINQEKKVNVFQDGARQAFNGAIDGILQNDTYDLVFIDSTTYRTARAEERLQPEQVQEIYAQHPHHLLLTLEHFETYLEQETVQEQDEDGDVSKIAFYDLVAVSSWVLYDSTGNVLDEVQLSESVYYHSRPVISGLLAIGPSLGNAGPAINDLAWHTGSSYWRRLSPQPVSFARPYYSGKSFQPAAIAMAAGDWQKALALLEPLTKSRNRKEAARASYNMAIFYETVGDIQQAKYWAKEANNRGDRLAAALLPELEKNYPQ